jgi:mono/diheme cytochrome c family protein
VRIELLVAATVALACLACGPVAEQSPVELGRRAYLANCIACHNQDPGRDGTIGPAIAGSSAALVEARVLRAQYPPGYTPKRDSHLMPAQPFLKKDVPDLAAYLESVAPK